MTTSTLKFMDKEFDVKLLEQAISKSAEVYIEAGKEIHEEMIAVEALPFSWVAKFKKPVLTIHQGRYVILVATADVLKNLNDTDKGIFTTIGFKAKFVTKYNFNQSKVVEPLSPTATPPAQPRPATPTYQDRAAPKWNQNNGFQKLQGSGYNRSHRSVKP